MTRANFGLAVLVSTALSFGHVGVSVARSPIVLLTEHGALAKGSDLLWTNTAFALRSSTASVECSAGQVTFEAVLKGRSTGAVKNASSPECESTTGLGPVQLSLAHLPWNFSLVPARGRRPPPALGELPFSARGALTLIFPEASATCSYQSVEKFTLEFRIGASGDERELTPEGGNILKLKGDKNAASCPPELNESVRFAVTSDGELVYDESEDLT